MTSANTCPNCGAETADDAAGGLCPVCLMTEGMKEGDTATVGDKMPGVGAVDVNTVDAVDESAGRYTFVGEHGKGGMGRVLLVHDEHLDRDIALKELLPDLGDGDGATPTPVRHSKEMAARFLREAKITGKLEHPSITPVHELGRRADGTLYYTMKLVKGRTLSEAIKDAGSLDARLKLLPHFVDLCQAIAYAHSRGVIHRDIKPSNVMVGDYGETVIIDWGLAKVKGKEDGQSDPAQETLLAMKSAPKASSGIETEYGRALGTPAYMPPEQAKGHLDLVDERSDVYSLGAVLYEILTGQAPFEGRSVQEVLNSVLHKAPQSIRLLERKAPKELIGTCERAMRKDHGERCQSAAELATIVSNEKTRDFYVNPLRPYMTDLVPELRPLSAKERRAVVRRASAILKKRSPRLIYAQWGKALIRAAFPVLCLVAMFCGALDAMDSLLVRVERDSLNLSKAQAELVRVYDQLRQLDPNVNGTGPKHMRTPADVGEFRHVLHLLARLIAFSILFGLPTFFIDLKRPLVPYVYEALQDKRTVTTSFSPIYGALRFAGIVAGIVLTSLWISNPFAGEALNVYWEAMIGVAGVAGTAVLWFLMLAVETRISGARASRAGVGAS